MNMQSIGRSPRSSIVGFLHPKEMLSADVLSRMAQTRMYLRNGQTSRAKAIADALRPLAPLDPKLMHLRADCAMSNGDFHDAITLFERALLQSDHADLWSGKGTALRALGRFRQAAACFQRASALAPKDTEHQCNAAESLLKAGQPQDAFDSLKLGTLNARARHLRAIALSELGNRKTAFTFAISALQEAPTSEALRLAHSLASSLQETTDLKALCKPIIARNESPVHLLAAAINSQNLRLSEIQLERVEEAAAQDIIQQSAAHHLLFRHHDTIDERDLAQSHLIKFHATSNHSMPYRRSRDSALFTVLKRLEFDELPPSKSSVLPIFVSGLPGSGRTYASQLLQNAARPLVARPLHLVNAVMTRFMRQRRHTGERDVSRDDLMGLQAELRAGLHQAANGAEIVIDTAMLNFRWSGLIKAALPEARIVHVKRNRMQTGWAMYSRDLQDADLSCRHNLDDLNSYQTQCRRLMRHWEQRSGGSIVSVSGDALSRPSGQSARAMVELCQMKWSESFAQVQETSQPDWYRYADLLAPLRNTQNTKATNTFM